MRFSKGSFKIRFLIRKLLKLLHFTYFWLLYSSAELARTENISELMMSNTPDYFKCAVKLFEFSRKTGLRKWKTVNERENCGKIL
jgi:hypothetical protein